MSHLPAEVQPRHKAEATTSTPLQRTLSYPCSLELLSTLDCTLPREPASCPLLRLRLHGR